MSKRITFTDDDIAFIIRLLNKIEPIKPYNDIEFAAVQRKQQIINKLNGQHPRSVETLGVSGNGDKSSIASQKEKTND